MLAEHYLLLHTLPMAAQTFGASAVILSPILNLFIVAAALLLFFTLIQNNFIRNMFAGIGFMSILTSLFSNDNSRGSRIYTHDSTFFSPPPYFPPTNPCRRASTHHRPSDIHHHPSTNRQNGFYPIHGHGINGHPSEFREGPRNPIHGHP